VRPPLRILAIAVLALAATAPTASAHKGNPNYSSEIRRIAPAVPGLSIDVLNRDDRFELVNHTGKEVLVPGYTGEPYARLLADGTVEVNQNSPATYLNTDRTGQVAVPASASDKAAPRWRTLDRTGRFEWHDHRMHWMGKNRPARVKDASKRTKVFDYRVPLKVDGRPVAIEGTLYWTGAGSGGFPIWGAIALALLAVGGGFAAMRHRARRDAERDRAAAGAGAPGAGHEQEPVREAW
jgi:hypothetical protein